jgi:hypothetical protein
MSEVVEVRASELGELEDEGREILARRRPEIEDWKLDGTHWFWTLIAQAKEVTRRRRVISARRSSRT